MADIVSHFSQPPYAGVKMISMPNVASYVPDSTKHWKEHICGWLFVAPCFLVQFFLDVSSFCRPLFFLGIHGHLLCSVVLGLKSLYLCFVGWLWFLLRFDLKLEVMGSSQYNINGFLHFWAGDHHCFTKPSNWHHSEGLLGVGLFLCWVQESSWTQAWAWSLTWGFDRQDVPTHAWTWHSLPWVWETRCTQARTWPCLTWVYETRWTQASTIFRRSCDACWLKNFIPLNRFTWLLIKLDFASDQCMRFGGWQKDFQHLNTIRLMPGTNSRKKRSKMVYYGQQAPFCSMKWDWYWACWAWSMSFCPV